MYTKAAVDTMKAKVKRRQIRKRNLLLRMVIHRACIKVLPERQYPRVFAGIGPA
jgi:hypothetical protein